MSKSSWDGLALVDRYLSGIEISTDDVHYGPLAAGEKELQLLDSVAGQRILEVGCGRAENCIALAKQGAICTGIDLSDKMISRAEDLARENGVEIRLMTMDARDLFLLPSGHYDIVISSYALGFTGDIKSCLLTINRCLKKNGQLVFCIGHPAQIMVFRKKKTLLLPERQLKGWRENYFTLNQMMIYVAEAGFLVERLVEQVTRNPSQLKEEEKVGFPYCLTVTLDPQYDQFTNQPHTVIYCCRKLDQAKQPQYRLILLAKTIKGIRKDK